MSQTEIDRLTPREREILVLIAEGDSLPEIAQKLHRSLKTIESHRLSLGRKLKASNRVELARIAIAGGLVRIKVQDTVQAAGDTSELAQTELAWLKQINDAVFNATGATFIKRFCDAVSVLPGITIGAVCTPDPTFADGTNRYHRFVIGISHRGQSDDPVRYHAHNTPCETIIKEGQCCFSQGVAGAYPKDAWLQQLKAESYFGLELTRADGAACGGVGLIGCEPIEDMDAYRKVIEFFAPRLAAELALCLELDALRTKCEQLENQVSVLDQEYVGREVGNGQTPYPSSELALLRISKDVQSHAGPTFMRALVDSICAQFGLKAAGICMFVKNTNKTEIASVIYSVEGKIADNFSYSPTDAPCEVALTKGFVSIPKGVAQAFPKDQMLSEKGLEGYIGIRLPDPLGKDIGILWVLHTQEITDPQTIERIFRHFAPRVGAELSNFLQLEELYLEQERLKDELAKRM